MNRSADASRYIVIEGPIGVGKTSLAKKLAESLSAELLLEECQMQMHFLVDIAIDLPASNERPEPPSERAEHRHGCPPIRPFQPFQ